MLAGGWYFATETARILGGAGRRAAARAGARRCSPPHRARRVRRRRAGGPERGRAGGAAMSWQLAPSRSCSARSACRFWWYERRRPSAEAGRRGRHAGGAGGAGPRRVRRDARRQADHRDRARRRRTRSAPGPASRRGDRRALASNILLGQGPWTPWQMLGWGLVGVSAALRSAAARPGGRSAARAGARVRARAPSCSTRAQRLHVDRGRQPHASPPSAWCSAPRSRSTSRTSSRASCSAFAFGPALLRMLDARPRAPGDRAGSRSRAIGADRRGADRVAACRRHGRARRRRAAVPSAGARLA